MVAASSTSGSSSELETRVADLARRGVNITDGPAAAQPGLEPPAHPVWAALQRLGTDLWLDTGDIDEAQRLWSSEFTALTTNNTLLSKEVGKGIYDALIRDAVGELRGVQAAPGDDVLVQEVGILLNAHHGLRLVEKFGCRVSVELHTDLAHDFEGSLAVARRLYAVCPSHFIVKVPLTPTGVLVARRLGAEGIPVNFTLEFSARQNYLIGRIANPDYVNVFLGRLNAFVADNKLGDGRGVGEKATLASQRELLELRRHGGRTRQIAASMRESGQIAILAGVDVFTMPIPVAEGMPSLGLDPAALTSQVTVDPPLNLSDAVEPAVLETLWNVPAMFKASVEALAREALDEFSGADLAEFFRARGYGDVFPSWSERDLADIAADGKLPSYARWRNAMEAGEVGLDAAFTAAGMASFALDQRALDERIRSLL